MSDKTFFFIFKGFKLSDFIYFLTVNFMMFKVAGHCPDVNYLFLGDYVDRGYFSVNTISLLICLYLKYPDRILYSEEITLLS